MFDGYDNVADSTKSHEQMIRAAKITSSEIQFGLEMKTVSSQEPFLSYHLNKSRLICNYLLAE